MKPNKLYFLFLSCLILIALLAGRGPTAAATASPAAATSIAWEISTVGSVTEGEVTGATAVALDSHGLHQVAYYDWTGAAVMLGREDESGWSSERVNTGAASRSYLDLVIDDDDTAVVTHHAAPNKLVYTLCYPNSCSGTQLPIPDGQRAGQEALVLTSSGRPAIAFAVGGSLMTGGKLVTGTYDGVWNMNDVDIYGLFGGTALTLDLADHPYVTYLYTDTSVYDLFLATYDGSAWQYDRVTENAEEDGAPSGPAIDLDDQGDPVISYLAGDGKVRLAQRPSGGGNVPWNGQVVANGPAHDRTALAYENGSKALVAYMDSSGLRVANKGGGGGWSSATIDPQGLAGLDMVMDSRGYPHISYLSSDAKVKVAVRAMREVELTPAEVALTAHTGSYVTYVLQLANKGNVLDTYDLSVDNTWHTAVLPQSTVTLAPGATTEVQVQLRVPEMAVGEDIATVTATSQMRAGVSATAELKTTVQPGQWLVSTAVPGPDNAHAPGLALDAAGLPFISFGSDTNALEVINMRSGGWRATLPAAGQVNPEVNTVLRFAENGLPSAAFADAANADAATIVTWEYGAASETKTVPGSAGVLDLGLALSPAGYPRLALADGGYTYAAYDPGGWTGHTDGYSGYYVHRTDVALDSGGAPHSAYLYFYPYQGTIVYLHRDGEQWFSKEVTEIGDWDDNDIAITTDSADSPLIAYSDVGYPQAQPPAGQVGLLRQVGETWQEQTLDQGPISEGLALAAAADHAALCYQAAGPRYAAVWPHGWSIDALSSESGQGCALGLDEAGQPQMAFRDAQSGDLRYAVFGTAALDLPAAAAAYGLPGSSVTYTLHLENSGTVSDCYNIAIDAAWETAAYPAVGPLLPGDKEQLIVTVTVPSTAERGSYDTAELTITSLVDPALSQTVTLTTTAGQPTLHLPAVFR